MRQRILIVDDEAPLATCLAEFLSDQGYDIHCANEPEEAMALLEHYSYDLLTVDLALTPIGLAGVDLLQFALDRAAPPKLIALTGNTDPYVKAELSRLGISCVLQKPLPLGEIAKQAALLLGGTQ